MKSIKHILLASAIILTGFMAGCGKNPGGAPKVKYIVEGKEASAAPDKNLFKAVSIESNSKEAVIIWDVTTWTLQTALLRMSLYLKI